MMVLVVRVGCGHSGGCSGFCGGFCCGDGGNPFKLVCKQWWWVRIGGDAQRPLSHQPFVTFDDGSRLTMLPSSSSPYLVTHLI